ncbi:Disintegrin And Metalloproteinase Domain-Containing Protein 29 [Manis pentadactyla]|nr:Disintegrin And Metalloproteinase Domain-Containing Protein 29 [Manis pentadactyla]
MLPPDKASQKESNPTAVTANYTRAARAGTNGRLGHKELKPHPGPSRCPPDSRAQPALRPQAEKPQLTPAQPREHC